ncbi:M13 family metallopeptidase [Gilvimarinus sp. F26214L]|uniref:M13 family metallopeptidase n=1 Tax=Gilvimarinus sp. DZF01 TaxID=3461371 RepID=UPI0040459A14
MRLAPMAIASAILALSGCDQAGNVATVSSAQPAEKPSGIQLDYMDTSVDPAENFFRYANGQWLENTEIPADKSRYGSFIVLADQAREDLKVIVEEAAAAEAEPGSETQQIGDFYKSFMDTDTIEARGLEPLEPLLADISEIENREQLAGFFARMNRLGVTTPLYFYINNDEKQPDQYIPYFGHSGLGLPDRDYYLKDDETSTELRETYREHVARMFELAGQDKGEEAAQTVLSIENDIAERHWSRTELRDREKTYNKVSVQDLTSQTETWKWDEFLGGAGLTAAESVVISTPDYFSELDSLLAAYSVDQWKDYLRWHTISAFASFLPEALDQENFRFYGTALSGAQEQEERWKRAMSLLDSSVGDPLGKLYVAEHFSPTAKARMEELVENLREAYRQSILGLDWMTEATKKKAIEKLEKFTPKIGYPDKWRDYSSLQVAAEDLFGNYLRAIEFMYQINVDKLGKPVDRSEWFMTPQTVNAYYNPVMNEIVFPAAILQPPFFNEAADDAINYGAIGAVIGHEMGHGFDDQGARSDGDGFLQNWWTEDDLSEFNRRTQQLVEQYSQYTVLDDLHVNGDLTQGENIGDLGGLTVAYKAYQLSLDGEEAPVLDGFTGDQRFFLGWGQVWANKYRDEELRRRIMTDPHSPPRFRVNGVLRNMPEFYAAFGVEPGDWMYLPPEERVKIW